MRRRPRRPYKVRASYARGMSRMFLEHIGVDKPPVPIYDIAREIARVEFFNNPDMDPGYTVVQSNGDYFIAINFTGTFERMFWTICHELAHIKLSHHVQFKDIELTKEEERILDREADIFTREFLMPEKWVRERINPCLFDRDDIIRLKNTFQVSWEALFIRLEELHILTADTARAWVTKQLNSPSTKVEGFHQ